MIVLPESEARETGSVTKTPGTSHSPALLRAGFEVPERAVDFWVAIGGSNHGHVIATSEEDARNGDVPGVFVTATAARHRSSTASIPGRPGHGHTLPGSWPGRPRPFPRRQLPGRVPYRGDSPGRPRPFPGRQPEAANPFSGASFPRRHPFPVPASRSHIPSPGASFPGHEPPSPTRSSPDRSSSGPHRRGQAFAAGRPRLRECASPPGPRGHRVARSPFPQTDPHIWRYISPSLLPW